MKTLLTAVAGVMLCSTVAFANDCEDDDYAVGCHGFMPAVPALVQNDDDYAVGRDEFVLNVVPRDPCEDDDYAVTSNRCITTRAFGAYTARKHAVSWRYHDRRWIKVRIYAAQNSRVGTLDRVIRFRTGGDWAVVSALSPSRERMTVYIKRSSLRLR